MDDGVDLVLFEDLGESLGIAHIGLIEWDIVNANDLGDTLEGDGVAVDEVIDYDHAVASFVKFDDGVAADVAGTATKEDVHTCDGLGATAEPSERGLFATAEPSEQGL